jgi:hypothetical protein
LLIQTRNKVSSVPAAAAAAAAAAAEQVGQLIS